MPNLDFKSILINIVALLVAIIPHEVAHGYVAYLCGDTTAKEDGRLSFNPIHHIDPIGLLSMVILRFGWAKAVPINPNRFTKNRKISSLLVALAGVFTNFVVGTIAGIFMVYAKMNNLGITPLIEAIFWYNIMLGVFNLLPLPPLDGSKVVATLLPEKFEYAFYKYEKYFYFILVFLLFSGYVSRIIGPIIMGIMEKIIYLAVGIWSTI